MHGIDLEAMRHGLLERRRTLLRRRAALLEEAQRLLETREPDWEDQAADESAAAALASLGESERRELGRIAAALQRLDRGAYGVCVDCGEEISDARLRAVPDADRCASCA